MTKARKTKDYDIRAAIVRELLAYGIDRAAIRHEIPLDLSSSDGRADIVVALDECLWGIEIKSGADTLDRLETQRDQYRRRFDRLVLAVDECHIQDQDFGYRSDFGDVAPFGVDGDGRISYRRPERFSFSLVPWVPANGWGLRQATCTFHRSPAAMLSMLWRDEVVSLAWGLAHDGVIPTCAQKTRCILIPHLAEHTPIAALRPFVATALRERKLNRWEVAFWERFDAEASAVAA